MASGAAGSYILTLTEDAGISTELTIRPGQDVHISGDPGLSEAPSWGSGGFTVEERGTLSLQHLTLQETTINAVSGGGSLSLTDLDMAFTVLGTALSRVSGVNSHLALQAVTLSERPDWGALTGTLTNGVHGQVLSPPDLPLPGVFVVLSGPCTTTTVDGNFCVGRFPGGYAPNEACEIAVVGGGGALGSCPVWSIDEGCHPRDRASCPRMQWNDPSECCGDYVIMPDGGKRHGFTAGGDCPVDRGDTQPLTAGQILSW
eukprot:COSAG04_NODE_9855_length_827_cov_1.100275_1_plen_258_part_10